MDKGVKISAATHVGLLRPRNEDRFCIPDWSSSGQEDSWQGYTVREGCWALVADGMGGHGAGEVASKVVVKILSKHLLSIPSAEGLVKAIQFANDKVHEAMYSEHGRPGMGSTVVGVQLHGQICTCFNVGDSRAYLLRRKQLRRLSLDHTPEGGIRQKFRSHALTRSLGGTVSRVEPQPHIEKVAVLPGDHILLCSDGLSDLISEDEIAELMEKKSSRPSSLLINSALKAGGRDNITVVLLSI